MLKVTLHSGRPGAATAENLLGRLDIGYDTLDAIADYKGVMVTTGLGEQAPVKMKQYPRWSASIWDLVARMVCLCIERKETIWPVDIPTVRRGAFIEDLTALVEHWPDGMDTRRSSVGSAHISMLNRRCNYRATFVDDILGTSHGGIFRHTPKVLTPWDLLTRAYAWTTTETFVLPPRPTLYTPVPLADVAKAYVALESVQEPARTGCYRWMVKKGLELVDLPAVAGACVTEEQFVEFLRTAV